MDQTVPLLRPIPDREGAAVPGFPVIVIGVAMIGAVVVVMIAVRLRLREMMAEEAVDKR